MRSRFGSRPVTPPWLQVDLGDDGTADFTFPRAAIDNIKIAAHGGDDTVRIDDTNGAFTDTIPTTHRRQGRATTRSPAAPWRRG